MIMHSKGATNMAYKLAFTEERFPICTMNKMKANSNRRIPSLQSKQISSELFPLNKSQKKKKTCRTNAVTSPSNQGLQHPKWLIHPLHVAGQLGEVNPNVTRISRQQNTG